MKMKVALVIMLTMLVLLIQVQNKKYKKYLERESPTTDSLRDKSQDPKNVRTKIKMLKDFIGSVLTQLGVSDLQIEESLNVSGSQLVACMDVFKDIARGQKTGKDLITLEKHLKLTNLKEKIEDDNNVNNAVSTIKTFVSEKNIN